MRAYPQELRDQVLCATDEGVDRREIIARYHVSLATINRGEDHLFLSETLLPLTKNGMTLLFNRLKKRAGITGKRVSPL